MDEGRPDRNCFDTSTKWSRDGQVLWGTIFSVSTPTVGFVSFRHFSAVAAEYIRCPAISGNIVNKADHGSLDWVKICERSTKVITFIDLAGHERYLKTTVFGMTGHAPDFGMLMVTKDEFFICEKRLGNP